MVLLVSANFGMASAATPSPNGGFSVIPPAPAEILGTLRKGHPRLLVTPAGLVALKQQAKTSAELKRWADSIRKDAEKIIPQEPSKYELPDGKRLLSISRRVRDRVMTLAMAYWVSQDKRFTDRAWKELDAAANFQDWHPPHFLDTAEMTAAFAMGYDWLYDAWTPQQRTVLRTAIRDKGLQAALAAYKKNAFWCTCHHNWNQVCHGGISMGALAIADDEPALAGSFLQLAIKNVPLAMREYGPDGAWGEGPGYWDYATNYTVLFLSSLESALGSDFGLSRIPGFSLCGSFPIEGAGSSGLLFNFADASDKSRANGSAPLFWLATQFQIPSYAAYQLRFAPRHPSALDFIWGAPWVDKNPQMAAMPLARHFRGTDAVFMRSAWDDPKATYLGFKAGRNGVNHGHLDLGSFVLDALGVRWASDPGSDNYNLPGYFDTKSQRWTYYRLRAEGHNTLVLNPGSGPDQNTQAAAPIVRFSGGPARQFVIADLTDAYKPAAASVLRGLALEKDGSVVVQDEIRNTSPTDVWWLLHTHAEIKISGDGASAVLTQGTARLQVSLASGSPAHFEIRAAAPLPGSPNPPNQKDNSDLHVLALHFQKAEDLRVAVRMTPWDGKSLPPQAGNVIAPLSAWK